MKKKLRILYLSAEVAPFNPESPLSEMSMHLSRIFRTMGHDIRVLTPKYSFVRERNYNLREVIRLREIPVPIGGKLKWVSIKSGFIPDTRVQVYFMENEDYFNRAGIVIDPETGEPYPDNDERFIAFSRASIEMLKILSWQPQIIHCTDYISSLSLYYLKRMYSEDPFFKEAKAILSLVNCRDSGIYPEITSFNAGLNPKEFKKGEDYELDGKFCFLKAGLINSDAITINGQNSVNNFEEPFNTWFQGFRKKNSRKIHVRKFGVDTSIWSPEKDDKISTKYSHKNLAGKSECKEMLISKYSLKIDEGAPLIGCIWNGGDFGFLKKIVDLVDKTGGALVVADKSATDEQVDEFKKSASERIGVVKLLTALTIKQLLAGSDIILLSSDKYKDMLHIKALNYGAVPVVPKTGYFWDDIVDEGPEKTGFLFESGDSKSMVDVMKTAVDLFKDQKSWTALQKCGMRNEFIWSKIAKNYFEIYEELI